MTAGADAPPPHLVPRAAAPRRRAPGHDRHDSPRPRNVWCPDRCRRRRTPPRSSHPDVEGELPALLAGYRFDVQGPELGQPGVQTDLDGLAGGPARILEGGLDGRQLGELGGLDHGADSVVTTG